MPPLATCFISHTPHVLTEGFLVLGIEVSLKIDILKCLLCYEVVVKAIVVVVVYIGNDDVETSLVVVVVVVTVLTVTVGGGVILKAR